MSRVGPNRLQPHSVDSEILQRAEFPRICKAGHCIDFVAVSKPRGWYDRIQLYLCFFDFTRSRQCIAFHALSCPWIRRAACLSTCVSGCLAPGFSSLLA